MKTLVEMLKHRDALLLRHPSLLVPCHHDSKYKLRAKRLAIVWQFAEHGKDADWHVRLIPHLRIYEYAPAGMNGFLSRLEIERTSTRKKSP